MLTENFSILHSDQMQVEYFLSFDALNRKNIFSFMSCLAIPDNLLIMNVNNNYICKYSIWNHWYYLLY